MAGAGIGAGCNLLSVAAAAPAVAPSASDNMNGDYIAAAPDFGPGFAPSASDNMNGDYVFSSTPGGTPGLFPKRYRDYPGGVETFDVLSPPMTT
eukprot:2991608-Prymnesium_polylepis.1